MKRQGDPAIQIQVRVRPLPLLRLLPAPGLLTRLNRC